MRARIRALNEQGVRVGETLYTASTIEKEVTPEELEQLRGAKDLLVETIIGSDPSPLAGKAGPLEMATQPLPRTPVEPPDEHGPVAAPKTKK